MGTVKSILTDRMVTVLTEACITDVDAGDATRVSAVVKGDYDGESLVNGIVLMALDSHPAENARWKDEMKDSTDDMGFELPVAFIGGSRSNCIRGTIKAVFNFRRATYKTDAEKLDIRQTVLARAAKAMRDNQSQFEGFTDDFQESVLQFRLARRPEYLKVAGNYVAYLDWSAWTIATPV